MPRRARYAVAAQSVFVLPTLPPRSRPLVRASQAVREIEVGWKDKRLTKEQSRLEHVRSLNKKQLKEEETGRQVRAAFFSIKKDSGSQVRVEAVEHAKVVEKSKEEKLASNRIQADKVRIETADEVRCTPNTEPWTPDASCFAS